MDSMFKSKATTIPVFALHPRKNVAQNGSAARSDGPQDLAVCPVDPAAMVLDEAITL